MFLPLHEFHETLGARFAALNGVEAVADYGDAPAEYAALTGSAGVLDLTFRGRLCLLGADRVRFLHGQVTNDIKKLRAGEGCYATLVTAKGKMQSDLNVFALADELLLDFEPGLTRAVAERLEKFIVADNVQVVDVAPQYGLLSVQGPKADAVAGELGWFPELPTTTLGSVKSSTPAVGELYLMNHPRLAPVAASGFDLFVPQAALGAVADKLIAAAKAVGGRACGWNAFETTRIEAGTPRYGADMDESTLPLECGLEARAVSYRKGCYIGQEVLNRIHSIGHVNRELRGFVLPADATSLPAHGDRLFREDKEVGQLTSAVFSPKLKRIIALGYVRREANQPGAHLTLSTATGNVTIEVASLPFAG